MHHLNPCIQYSSVICSYTQKCIQPKFKPKIQGLENFEVCHVKTTEMLISTLVKILFYTDVFWTGIYFWVFHFLWEQAESCIYACFTVWKNNRDHQDSRGCQEDSFHHYRKVELFIHGKNLQGTEGVVVFMQPCGVSPERCISIKCHIVRSLVLRPAGHYKHSSLYTCYLKKNEHTHAHAHKPMGTEPHI